MIRWSAVVQTRNRESPGSSPICCRFEVIHFRPLHYASVHSDWIRYINARPYLLHQHINDPIETAYSSDNKLKVKIKSHQKTTNKYGDVSHPITIQGILFEGFWRAQEKIENCSRSVEQMKTFNKQLTMYTLG